MDGCEQISEACHVINDDRSGSQLDSSESTDQVAIGEVDEASRGVVGISAKHRPGTSEGVEEVMGFVVSEPLDSLCADSGELAREGLGVDGGSVVDNDAAETASPGR